MLYFLGSSVIKIRGFNDTKRNKPMQYTVIQLFTKIVIPT